MAEAGRGSEGNESFTGNWGLLVGLLPVVGAEGPVPAVFGAGLEDERGNWPICTAECEGGRLRWDLMSGPNGVERKDHQL